jgi:hypothetical protein
MLLVPIPVMETLKRACFQKSYRTYSSFMKSRIMSVICAAIFTSGTTQLCSARLGETLDECKARYGELIRTNAGKHVDFPTYVFQKGNIAIGVQLLNGKSAHEDFVPLTGNLTDQQIQEIFEANSEGAGWLNGPPTKEDGFLITNYSRRDGLAQARHAISAKDEILTVEHLALVSAKKKPASGF